MSTDSQQLSPDHSKLLPPQTGREAQEFLRDLDRKLWSAADRLRANLDAAVYKHAVLGLIFLKYVSDAFAIRQREIEAQRVGARAALPGIIRRGRAAVRTLGAMYRRRYRGNAEMLAAWKTASHLERDGGPRDEAAPPAAVA